MISIVCHGDDKWEWIGDELSNFIDSVKRQGRWEEVRAVAETFLSANFFI